MNVRIKLGVVAASVAALALSACGSSSLSGETGGGGQAPRRSRSARTPTLPASCPRASRTPASSRSASTQATPPTSSWPATARPCRAWTSIVFNQSPSKFGVKTEWHPADFGSIINGVNGKKYDMGISSFTINPERMKQVNMVSYFRAGTQWATAAGQPQGHRP